MRTLTRFAPLTLAATLALTFALPGAAGAAGVPAVPAAEAPSVMEHVAWSRNATLYQVNVRQYSKEGTFNAVTRDLPRLKKLGADILWLMPVNPIGKDKRKGTLGSYYAVSDYTGVNPEFGTLADLKRLVKQAHGMGMKVILDWVPNHTAWDHPWVKQHPEYYKKNAEGNVYPVTYGEGPTQEIWEDVVGLDYTSKALWPAMTEAMAYWLREADIDGFRCDVASGVPQAYWQQAVADLNKIKPIFMLAEGDWVEMHDRAFDATYSWDLADTMRKIAKGEGGAQLLRDWVAKPPRVYPADAYRMRFTNNHDFNSWVGTDRELYGPAYQAMAVLTFTLPGMPLVYNGQESGIDKRLEFFEKDPIDWKKYELTPFYAGLAKLKHANPALWNGQYGGDMVVRDAGNENVFAFTRTRGANVVDVAVNLSGAQQQYTGKDGKPAALAPWRWTISAGKAH
ncbi:alpha-amylase family glycosyl hydrolase [Pseudoduganella ginsengisoli]|uniref:Alpha-amylase n=1 Tax=Pseudoduganella ginsengisoli TaxID=1462440 RepID=A0A6L6PVK1_9BURK|nr:alpha-amylase family glycosyl hydrolase [Pseudoduganella ginsengisoli]MTW00682.1 alpha-amylase [Pseudoduganella ginsengisoli]